MQQVERTAAGVQDLIDDFELLGDWEERYRYIIELGRSLAPLTDEEHSAVNKVEGCASQVWLVCDKLEADHGKVVLRFRGDSDAHIVRGLIAVLLRIVSDRTPAEILDSDIDAAFAGLGLRAHLTQQRSNGVSAMIRRIKDFAARHAT